MDALAHVDVWGVNSYRGASFGDLFDRWASLSPRPMWVSEYGADSFSAVLDAEDEDTQASEVAQLAAEIASHAAASGGTCLGGCAFEWADEWWKHGPGAPTKHDAVSTWSQAGYVDEAMHEEWFVCNP